VKTVFTESSRNAPPPTHDADLDLQIFTIPTAATERDRLTFLRLQRLVRNRNRKYTYLEIGSENGGSLVPHLADADCQAAISVDLRPDEMPDERGVIFDYPGNSSVVMLQMLKECVSVGPELLKKLTTFECDVSNVQASQLPAKPDLVLIDGEHTNTACFSDFTSILKLASDDVVIAFHDSQLISDAMLNAENMLRYLGIPFSTLFFHDHVGAIALRAFAEPLQDLSAFAHDRREYLERVRREKVHAMLWMQQHPSAGWRSF
jgi:hypothetical protein